MSRNHLAELGSQFGKSQPPPPRRGRSAERKAPIGDSSRPSSSHKDRGCSRSPSWNRHDERKRLRHEEEDTNTSRHALGNEGEGKDPSSQSEKRTKRREVRPVGSEGKSPPSGCPSDQKPSQKEVTSTFLAQVGSKSMSSTIGASQSKFALVMRSTTPALTQAALTSFQTTSQAITSAAPSTTSSALADIPLAQLLEPLDPYILEQTKANIDIMWNRLKTAELDIVKVAIREKALSYKYDLAKKQIGHHKAEIEMQKKEIKWLSEALDNKCSELIQVEERVKELTNEITIVSIELRTAQDERAKYLEESIKLAADLDILATEKENIQRENELLAAEVKRLREDNIALTKDKQKLRDETVDLSVQLAKKTSLIEKSCDLIDNVYYNVWKYKGLSWLDSYASILLMIRRRVVQEARKEAESRAEEFDEDMYLLNTFSDEERRLQAEAMTVIEEENNSSSGSNEVSGSGESTGGSKGEA